MFLGDKKKWVMTFVVASFAAIGALLVFVALIVGTFTRVRDDPESQARTDKNQKDVEEEFRQLPPLSGAAVIQQGPMHTESSALPTKLGKVMRRSNSIITVN